MRVAFSFAQENRYAKFIYSDNGMNLTKQFEGLRLSA